MDLISDQTRWFFILPSFSEPEDRHIYDVVFGVACLLHKSIKYDLISIVIDNATKPQILAAFSRFNVTVPNRIYKTDEISSLLKQNTSKNAVVFVTGHGSSEGLAATNPIKPFPLYKDFQTAPDFKRVVFYFGQCFAGIFNYMPLSDHLGLHNQKCSMIAIGSTGLDYSISSYRKFLNAEWSANIFLSYIFDWLDNPIDIDGDLKTTVMDSFKYASLKINEAVKQIKTSSSTLTILAKEKLQAHLEKLRDTSMTETDKDQLILEIQSYKKALELVYVEQAPWILNAKIAMLTSF